MTDTATAASPARLLEAAEALVPALRDSAREAELAGRLTDDAISGFRDAGFFTAMRPTEAGGAAIGLGTFIDITRTLARGDASAGWVGGFLISHQWLLSRLPLKTQAEIFDDGPGLAAAAAAPPGAAERVDGGYLVTGRWRFASAIRHANWVIVSAMGPAGPLAVVANVNEGRRIDTWQVPGMKATGSDDFELDGTFIPGTRVVGFLQYASRENEGASAYPEYEALQYPMYRVLSLIHGAVAVGTAEAALELFPAAVAKRIRPGSGQPVLEEPETAAAYGEATQLTLTARLLLDDAVARTERLYARGTADPSVEELALLNLETSGSGTDALRAVDVLVQGAGASVMRDGTPLEIICRNTQVMRNHIVLDWRHTQRLAGRIRLGLGMGVDADAQY